MIKKIKLIVTVETTPDVYVPIIGLSVNTEISTEDTESCYDVAKTLVVHAVKSLIREVKNN